MYRIMKNYFFITALLLFGNQAFACDVCGCSLGAFSQGIIPDYTSHFIGVRYNLAHFRAEIDHGTIGGFEFSEDKYNRIELVGRYNATEKLKFNFYVPFVINQMKGSEQTTTKSGLGDPMFLVNYKFLKKEVELSQHYLTAGAGIKFPLGKSDLLENEELLNRNFQPGSGSFDFILTTSYYFRKKKMGYTLESSYKMNTTSNSGYRFGNQFNFSANMNYRLERPKLNWLIYGGVYFEQASRHTENESFVFNTGGYGIYANAGVQFYFSKMRLSTGIQHPIYQYFNTDNMTSLNSSLRINADLIIFIRKKNN